MVNKKFSIVEMAIVVTVILILFGLSMSFYKSVQGSMLVKAQQLEFDNIRLAIMGYKEGIRIQVKPCYNHVNIYDLVYTYELISEKRVMLVNGKDKTKSDAKIMSYFDTPIEVYVTKQKNGATEDSIKKGYKKITGHEYLTGDFEFYFGNEHEVDGGESGAPPVGTKFGLIGNGTIDDGHQYYYKFVYEDPNRNTVHEYYLH